MELALLLAVAFLAGLAIGLSFGGLQARRETRRREEFMADLHRHNEMI